MNKIFKILNNNRKNVSPWQCNWFFATTVFITLLNIILYGTLGSWEVPLDSHSYGHWHDCLYFTNLLHVFCSAYSHANWQHVLLNMLCFFICGIYLERKMGSLNFFLLIMAFSLFEGCAIAANNNSIAFHGFSGVNYAIYAYIVVDYLFCAIQKDKRNKLDLIYGGVMLGLIYFAACFNGGTSKFSFAFYPYDAMYNMGHYTSFFVGFIMSAARPLLIFFSSQKAQPPLEQ
ncbi:MAG: rhomboid family intramembrane serine protease [Clostridiales bacterium]|nr:rhomboid family intramembrane serine protease [Clostridiales bacterium]